MPNLYNTTTDNSQPIATFEELRAAMPVTPVNPSIYALDNVPGFIVQITYGTPDRHHATVTVFTDAVDKDTFDNFKDATERFIAIARDAFE